MVQYQLKLRMTKAQEAECKRWLYHLASVWNWAARKIELNAKDKIYFSKNEFQNLLAGHSQKLGIPSHVLQGILSTVYEAWQRCFRKLGRLGDLGHLYSWRKASTGSRRDARTAGTIPLTNPTAPRMMVEAIRVPGAIMRRISPASPFVAKALYKVGLPTESATV